MTMELVDGRAGEPHIDSADMGILHQALYGKGSYVLDWGKNLACVMQDANHAVVGTGCGMIQGLSWTLTGSETIRIDSGAQSQNRNDIIAAHYHRDTGTNVESIELKVVKGSSTYGTPSDPAVPSGVILEGATDAYMPLWRIPISGIVPGTPVRLFETLPSLRDSISRTTTSWNPPYYGGGFLTLEKAGKVVTATGSISMNNNMSGATNVRVSEMVPTGFRPANSGSIFLLGNNSQSWNIRVGSDGSCLVSGSGNRGYFFTVLGSWISD